MNIYFLPTSENGMKDRLFEVSKAPYEGGMGDMQYWRVIRDALEGSGHSVRTADAWSREARMPDDVLVVQNHPGETFAWRAFYALRNKSAFALWRRRFFFDTYRLFARRVLIQGESPLIMPYVYKGLPALRRSGMYQNILIFGRGWGEEFGFVNFYDYRDRDIVSPYFNDPKSKFLILMNSNVGAANARFLFHPLSAISGLKLLRNELYGERLKAIRYFSEVPGFDLYGPGWEKPPKHLFPRFAGYKRYVDRVWRGRAENKMKVMSEYKFAICYENASYKGYITEKLYDALAVGTIPVYRGAPDIESIVPKNCFIDGAQFENYAALHKHLASLPEAACEEYRQNILHFLRDRSTMKGAASIVRDIVG